MIEEKTETYWSVEFSKLNTLYCEGTEEDRIRAIARQEANRQLTNLINVILFFGAAFWASNEYGFIGIAASVVVGIGLLWYLAKQDDRNPAKDRHLITLQAETLARLNAVSRAHSESSEIWSLQKSEGSDERQVNLKNGPWWDDFWERAHEYATQLEYAGPAARKKRIADAARRQKDALKQAQALAKHENVSLNFWVASAIEKL